MSAHTRGPWSIVLNPIAENGAAVTSIYAADARQSYVADVYRGYVGSEGLSEEEHRDNARLIAAAPELLDVCLLMRHLCELNNALATLADSVIAKAKGKA